MLKHNTLILTYRLMSIYEYEYFIKVLLLRILKYQSLNDNIQKNFQIINFKMTFLNNYLQFFIFY